MVDFGQELIYMTNLRKKTIFLEKIKKVNGLSIATGVADELW